MKFGMGGTKMFELDVGGESVCLFLFRRRGLFFFDDTPEFRGGLSC